MGGAAGAAGAGGGPSRLNPGEVFSQPANTGSGFHENTQLASAIEALKVRYCSDISGLGEWQGDEVMGGKV